MPGRVQLLDVLLERDATVSDLADRLALDQPRVSTHLAALRGVGLVDAHAAGRQRVYRVDAARVRPLLAALDVPPRSAEATRLVRRDAPLRQARTCYDHLAGVAGVQLLDAMLERGWLSAEHQPRRVAYAVTSAGQAALAQRGVDLDQAHKARRMFAFACIDWTERRPHLGGSLGAAVLDALAAAHVATSREHDRGVVLERALDDWLDAR